MTPPLGSRLCGYPVHRPAESIHDPLNSTALVLSRDGVQAAIVSLDWVIIEDDDVQAVRKGVHERTGIPPANITICAIQTHTGPQTITAWGWGDKDTAYTKSAIPRIVDSVVQAHARLQPARLGIATIQSDVGVNRRGIGENHAVGLGYNPWGPYDPTMTVLRFEGAKGPLCSLVHYGAHPTALGVENYVSRDWPGVMVDRIETITGAPALYVNGAVGDIAPRTNILRATGDGWAAAEEVGQRAAHHALTAFRGIRDFSSDATLRTMTRELRLPYAPLTPLTQARRELRAALPNKDKWGSGMCHYTHWQQVIEAHRRPVKKSLRFTQTLTQVGPAVFVPFAGEPFAEIVLRLRDLSPYQYTLCASTTNGKHGYYVTRESRARGGYEVWVARAYGAYILADNIDDVLVEQNLRMLRELYR